MDISVWSGYCRLQVKLVPVSLGPVGFYSSVGPVENSKLLANNKMPQMDRSTEI